LICRARPAAGREAARGEHPEWWSRVQQGLRFEGRHAADTNFYDGGEGGADRAALLSQLTDPQIWAAAPNTPGARQLRNVVHMAMAAGLGERVHHYARSNHAFPAHAALLNAAGVTDAERYEAAGGPARARETGALDVLGAMGPTTGSKGAVGARVLEVDTLQDYGAEAGDLGGVEFERDHAPAQNRLNVMFSREQGRLAARGLDGFAIRRIDTRVGDRTVRTGPATLGPVSLVATFPTAENPNQTSRLELVVSGNSILHDVVLVSPGSMVAIAQVQLADLQVVSSELPFDPASVTTTAAAHEQLKAMSKTNDLIDDILFVFRGIAAYLDMSPVTDEIVRGIAAPEMTGPGRAIVKVGALALEGITTSGGAHVDSVMVRDFGLSLDHTPSAVMESRIEELATRMAWSERRVAELAATLTPSSADEHERDRVHTEYAAMEKEIATLRAELPKQKKRDQRYVDLYTRDRRGEPLSHDERKELKTLRAEMTTGLTVHMGNLDVRGAGRSPGDRVDKFSVTGLTAYVEGKGPGTNPLAGFLTDPTVLTGRKRDGTTTVSTGLSVDRIQIEGARLAGSAPNYKALHAERQRLMSIPERNAAELQALLDLDMQFQTRVADGKTFGEIVDKVLDLDRRIAETQPSTAAAADTTTERSLRAERDVLLRHLASASKTSVKSLDIRGVRAGTRAAGHVGADGEVGVTGLGEGVIGEARMADLESGDVSLGSLELDDVGVESFISLFKAKGSGINAIAEGRVNAGRIHAENIETAGTHVGALDVVGLTGEVDTRKDGGTVGLHAGEIAASGVRRSGRIRKLEAEEKALAALLARTPLQDKRLDEIRATLKELRAAVDRVTELTARVAELERQIAVAPWSSKRKLKAELVAAKAELAAAKQTSQGAADESFADFHFRDIGVTASGLGDFLSEGHQLEGRDVTLAVHLGGFDAGALRFGSGATNIAFAAAHVSGLDVGVSVRVTRDAAGQLSVTPLALASLDLGEASVRSLDVTFPLKSGEGAAALTEAVRVVVPEAKLVGVHARAIPFTGEAAFRTGSLKVEAFHAAVEAKIGDYFKAGGALKAEGLDLDALTSGSVTLDLRGGITAEGLGFTATGDVPKGSIVERLRGSSALVTRVSLGPSTTRVDTATGAVTTSLGTITLEKLRYAAGSRVIEARSKVTLEGVSARASLSGEASADKAARPFVIDELRIARIIGDGIHYQDGTGDETKAFDLRHGVVDDVLVTSLNLGAGTLTADVGHVKIEGARYTKGPELRRALEINVGATARGLHYARARDGAQTIRIGDLGGSVSGQAGGTRFGLTFSGARTGEGGISITDTRIHVPSFTLGNLTLKGLDYKGESARVRTIGGGRAMLNGLQVNDLIIELEKPDPAHPDKSAMRSISVRELRVTETLVNGLELTLYGGTTTVIRVPASVPASLQALTVKDFAMDGGTKKIDVGSFGIELALIRELEDGVGKRLAGDISAVDLNLTTITADGHSVDIEGATAKSLSAGFGEGSKVEVRTLNVSGIRHDEKEGTSVRSASFGFTYTDGNLFIDAGAESSITLPDGIRVPKGPRWDEAVNWVVPEDGPISLPNVTLREVKFGIMRLDELLASGKGGGSSGSPLFDYDFLDTLGGTVAVTINLHRVPALGDLTLRLKLPIVGGVVSFAELEKQLKQWNDEATVEDEAKGALADFFIDFTLKEGRYLTVSRALHHWALPPEVRFGAKLALGPEWICRWDLGEFGRDLNLYKDHDMVRIAKLPDIEMAPSDPDEPSPITVDIGAVDAQLSMLGPSHIELKGGPRIYLGDDQNNGMLNFTAKGKSGSDGISLALEALNISSVQNIRLGDGLVMGTGKGGRIIIRNVHDTRITLDGIKPKTLEGTIGLAQATNLLVTRK
ncbi:MAG TPA: hypothetical protein VE093_25670, partial [Polyangiaceae bacterium]|nr:hypothetical protein [Polyangiaceae bacterium]